MWLAEEKSLLTPVLIPRFLEKSRKLLCLGGWREVWGEPSPAG
jgi:hypothetical protein